MKMTTALLFLKYLKVEGPAFVSNGYAQADGLDYLQI